MIVLGGGTTTAPDGRGQLSRAGDRLRVAARLFHAERTPQLVVTGEHIAEISPGDGDPCQESAEILGQLLVPKDQIIQLPGRSTFEEIAAVAEWSERHPEFRRLGLITSAWHMPRALRLAEARGLELEPLPADFCGHRRPWTILSAIPNADGVILTQLALKEVLAGLAGQ